MNICEQMPFVHVRSLFVHKLCPEVCEREQLRTDAVRSRSFTFVHKRVVLKSTGGGVSSLSGIKNALELSSWREDNRIPLGGLFNVT